MEEHKIVTATKQTRSVDPRMILLNSIDQSDETLSLRLAAIVDFDLFYYLFTSPQWDSIYTSKHLLDILAFFMYIGRYDLIAPVLRTSTAKQIFLNSSYRFRRTIVDLVNSIPSNHGYEAVQLFEGYPYNRLDRDITNMSLSNIYSLIREDEFEKLQIAISNGEIDGIA
ncbi:MAG: hypothetical protein ACMG6E_07015 [Candidatus Roizmanbacteria bacterium]